MWNEETKLAEFPLLSFAEISELVRGLGSRVTRLPLIHASMPSSSASRELLGSQITRHRVALFILTGHLPQPCVSHAHYISKLSSLQGVSILRLTDHSTSLPSI